MDEEHSHAAEGNTPTKPEAARPRRRGRKHAEVANDQDDVFAQATASQQEHPPAPVVDGPSLNGAPAHDGQAEDRPNVKQANTVTDAAARMKYHHNYAARPQKAAITFDDGRPSEAVRQALKDAGFRWNNDAAAWEVPIHFPTRAQDRQHARATFDQVAEMRREELGLTAQR